MIKNLGIGIDIIEVSRFRRKKYEENRNFYKKIFVKSEINYCLKFKNSSAPVNSYIFLGDRWTSSFFFFGGILNFARSKNTRWLIRGVCLYVGTWCRQCGQRMCLVLISCISNFFITCLLRFYRSLPTSNIYKSLSTFGYWRL